MKNLTTYRQRTQRRPRLWNVCPQVTDYMPGFRRVFSGWSKARHGRRYAALTRLIDRLTTLHAAAIEAGERAFGADGVLLSGGSREHWPRTAKDACLIPAQAITTYRDAARMHARLAGIRHR